jgi:carbamoyl-phosphate synthase small subunit
LGNTGVNPEDEESIRPQVKGAIAKNICHLADNWRSSQSLPDYLPAHHVIGIYGIDTRSLTRKIRSVGAMNGAISTEILDYHDLLRLVQAAPQYGRVNLVKEVTTKEVYEWTTPTPSAWEFAPIDSDQEPLTVVAIDFGIKRNILRRLASYGCRVIVVPADTPRKIAEYNPDGIFFSNGSGDLAAVTEGIALSQATFARRKTHFWHLYGSSNFRPIPRAETFKLKFGHCRLKSTLWTAGNRWKLPVRITVLPCRRHL